MTDQASAPLFLQRGNTAGAHDRGVPLPESDGPAEAHPSPRQLEPHHTALRSIRFASASMPALLGRKDHVFRACGVLAAGICLLSLAKAVAHQFNARLLALDVFEFSHQVSLKLFGRL